MSKSIWLSECDPAELKAESPHRPCGRGEGHDGHAWRGTRKAFRGAVEITSTYWCEGVVDAETVETAMTEVQIIPSGMWTRLLGTETEIHQSEGRAIGVFARTAEAAGNRRVYLLTRWHHEPVSPTYVHATQQGALDHANDLWGTTLSGWTEKRTGRWEHVIGVSTRLGTFEHVAVIEEQELLA